MGINFLQEKQDKDKGFDLDQEKKKDKKSEKVIQWSDPKKKLNEKNAIHNNLGFSLDKDKIKQQKIGFLEKLLNLFKKKKDIKDFSKKNKTKNSRKETLAFINQQKKDPIFAPIRNSFLLDSEKNLKEEEEKEESQTKKEENQKEKIKEEISTQKEKVSPLDIEKKIDFSHSVKKDKYSKYTIKETKNNKEKNLDQNDIQKKKEDFSKEEEKKIKAKRKFNLLDFLKKLFAQHAQKSLSTSNPLNLTSLPQSNLTTPKKKEKINWESFRVLQSNFLKGDSEHSIAFDWKKDVIILIISILVATSIVGAAYFDLSYWIADNEIQVSDLDQKIITLEQNITKTENEIELLEAQMKIISEVLDKHIYWTNFFQFLEEYTLNEIHYQKFSGTPNGQYALSATAPNFSIIEAQINKMLESKYVRNVSVDSATNNGNNVGFNLNLNLDPIIFIE